MELSSLHGGLHLNVKLSFLSKFHFFMAEKSFRVLIWRFKASLQFTGLFLRLILFLKMLLNTKYEVSKY